MRGRWATRSESEATRIGVALQTLGSHHQFTLSRFKIFGRGPRPSAPRFVRFCGRTEPSLVAPATPPPNPEKGRTMVPRAWLGAWLQGPALCHVLDGAVPSLITRSDRENRPRFKPTTPCGRHDSGIVAGPGPMTSSGLSLYQSGWWRDRRKWHPRSAERSPVSRHKAANTFPSWSRNFCLPPKLLPTGQQTESQLNSRNGRKK